VPPQYEFGEGHATQLLPLQAPLQQSEVAPQVCPVVRQAPQTLPDRQTKPGQHAPALQAKPEGEQQAGLLTAWNHGLLLVAQPVYCVPFGQLFVAEPQFAYI